MDWTDCQGRLFNCSEDLRHEVIMRLINMGIGIHMEVRPIATNEEIETESKNIRFWAEETADEILADILVQEGELVLREPRCSLL